MFIEALWILVRVLTWGALAVALVGVAIFGLHFVRTNAAAARRETNDVPAYSWRGPRAKLGFLIIGIGVAMQIIAIILATVLRDIH
jgi:hypothetical protein